MAADLTVAVDPILAADLSVAVDPISARDLTAVGDRFAEAALNAPVDRYGEVAHTAVLRAAVVDPNGAQAQSAAVNHCVAVVRNAPADLNVVPNVAKNAVPIFPSVQLDRV